MHDLLFERQDEWAASSDPRPLFDSYAESLGLDMDQFHADADAQSTLDFIKKQAAAGKEAGVNHTPWFVIGDESVLPRSLEQFEAIQAALQEAREHGADEVAPARRARPHGRVARRSRQRRPQLRRPRPKPQRRGPPSASRRPRRPASPRRRWVPWTLGAAYAGFVVSAYLTIVHYRGYVSPCYVVQGCETVQTSKYSVDPRRAGGPAGRRLLRPAVLPRRGPAAQLRA